ncbi:MAG: carboxypeptidase regulatory-like domain-containing protein, partial [Bacteroidota bacterium]
MKTLFLFFTFCLVCTTSIFSQNNELSVSGKLIDVKENAPITGATVLMINIKDSSRSRYAVSDIEGRFVINQLGRAFYRMQVRSLGYEPFTKILRITLPQVDLGTVPLTPDVTALDEMVVEGEVVAVQQIGDTTQYDAAAYKVNPDASAKDLVSKMPGIVVDSDGVTSNGESIEQVLLDGKRFFGQDPLLSLNTIPADIIDKVQVYDEESDQSQFTGFSDGNTTLTMNVVTKEDKRNGQFGRMYAGVGEDQRYKAGVNINAFNKDQRITFLGMTNNINQQNFGSEDLVGVGGGRGGFRRGGNQNFLTGTQNGITRTHSTGINFTDDLSDRTTFEGSYFYNQTKNNNNQLLTRESFLDNAVQHYEEAQDAVTDNGNHRLNFRINHKINEYSNFLVRSSFSHQHQESHEQTQAETTNGNGNTLSETYNDYSTLSNAYNFSNRMTYQRKFEKVGRTVSIDFNNRINPNTEENRYEDLERDSVITYNSKEGIYSLGTTITFTEPIGTTAQFAISYNHDHTLRKSDIASFVRSNDNEEGLF